ncbi:MAG: hypothetical protein CMK49_01080 [Prochlorococcus sp. SP3034]|nr:hypothetical protein [Prochlorococcus sp. SP3034]|tara:strand:+ start:5323 stop:6066 length:744 start_codon:yes stop_codon:yes gene_type:complete
MKVSIMQPNIFMWGGLLKSLLDSDLHVIRDDVKSTKNSRFNRNRIAGNSDVIWLTIPFVKFRDNKLIGEQYLNTSHKTVQKIKQIYTSRYKGYKYYQDTLNLISSTLDFQSDETLLCDVYLKFLKELKLFGFPICEFTLASSLEINKNGEEKYYGLEMVNKILAKTKAETYLAAENTINYAQPDEYKVKNVMLQKYEDLPYKNLDLENAFQFNKNLSSLDIISNLSVKDAIEHVNLSNNWKLFKNFN